MSKWFTLFVIGVMLVGFTSCSSTPSDADSLQYEIEMMRAKQEADVDDLQSAQNTNRWYDMIGSDLKRHNWLEWPVIAPIWGLTFISTGHQRQDFIKMHKDMDRYFFNAAWDDPYLND